MGMECTPPPQRDRASNLLELFSVERARNMPNFLPVDGNREECEEVQFATKAYRASSIQISSESRRNFPWLLSKSANLWELTGIEFLHFIF